MPQSPDGRCPLWTAEQLGWWDSPPPVREHSPARESCLQLGTDFSRRRAIAAVGVQNFFTQSETKVLLARGEKSASGSQKPQPQPLAGSLMRTMGT